MERILTNRIYHIAETNNMFRKVQAGFRKGRRCEDTIRRLIHKILMDFTKNLVYTDQFLYS